MRIGFIERRRERQRQRDAARRKMLQELLPGLNALFGVNYDDAFPPPPAPLNERIRNWFWYWWRWWR
jgi:hypothetical protein